MAARSSVLTNGLDGLAQKSSVLARMLKDLYALDDELQVAHEEAKRDDENGERVVTAYQAFLRYRVQFIQQLEKEKLAVPWQLRMSIDDIELTLRQRKEKDDIAAGKQQPLKGANDATSRNGSQSKPTTSDASSAGGDTATLVDQDDTKDADPLLLLKAMILPSIFIALIAAVVYFIASHAD